MEYTIIELRRLTGISSRTLRYYDDIGLLRPLSVLPSGMRIYGEEEVDRLQQILFFRELSVPLSQIKTVMSSPKYDSIATLKSHREALRAQKQRIENLIESVEATIRSKQEGTPMPNSQKFSTLKTKSLQENEKKYGKEIRARFGEDVVNESNRKYAGMDQETYERMERLSHQIIQKLLDAMEEKDPKSPKAQELVRLHQEWLMIFWPTYSPEAHKGLADGYVSDERFKKYYDQHRTGAAQFLRDCIHANV